MSKANTHEKPPARISGRGIPIPLGMRLKVRNLYLAQSLTAHAIATQCGLNKRQVECIIHRDGLPVLKKRRFEQLAKRTDERATAQLEAFNEQLAEEAEEISLGALKRAREETESAGEFSARNFQSWTGGIANLVKASRMVRGLDSKGGNADGSTSVSVFLVRGETIDRAAPKNVTPGPQELPA